MKIQVNDHIQFSTFEQGIDSFCFWPIVRWESGLCMTMDVSIRVDHNKKTIQEQIYYKSKFQLDDTAETLLLCAILAVVSEDLGKDLEGYHNERL